MVTRSEFYENQPLTSKTQVQPKRTGTSRLPIFFPGGILDVFERNSMVTRSEFTTTG